MSEAISDLKRVASSSGFYAAGQLLNRGLALILLPVYTRFLDPSEYGALELLNTFSGVLFVFLLLGLPSAVTKCYHRDCETPRDRATVLTTALLLATPVLLVSSVILFLHSERVGLWIVGASGTGTFVRLVAATAISASLISIVLASFRAREKALTFVVLNLAQFVPAMLLNIVLVVVLDMGVLGVLLGNLVSSLIALPLALWVARRDTILEFNRALVRPLLSFGMLLVPVTLAGWFVDLSDRYVLRLYEDLGQIAIYGVGYKIGTVLNLVVVWPFQLAWPAVSFSISHRADHKDSYARTLTYLFLVLMAGFLGLSLLSRAGLTYLVGAAFRDAYTVVPWVALAYVLNGMQFCVAPGIHITKSTKYLPAFSGAAAILNVGLNFLVVPRFGILGAAVSTTVTFLFLATMTTILSQRVYPIRYEYTRLAKIAGAAALTYSLGLAFEPEGAALALAWQTICVAVVFPLILVLVRFPRPGERAALMEFLRKYSPGRSGRG
jgi:O-antigen/teichoic acid export membrane protein